MHDVADTMLNIMQSVPVTSLTFIILVEILVFKSGCGVDKFDQKSQRFKFVPLRDRPTTRAAYSVGCLKFAIFSDLIHAYIHVYWPMHTYIGLYTYIYTYVRKCVSQNRHMAQS